MAETLITNATSISFYKTVIGWFDQVAGWAVAMFGTATAFVAALSVVIVWATTGPLFRFSDTWQLVINTSTTIVTFLMVFLLQHSQNKDSHAIHAKLNELLAATEGASNRLIDLEDLTEEDIDRIRRRFQHLSIEAEHLQPGEKTTIEGTEDEAK